MRRYTITLDVHRFAAACLVCLLACTGWALVAAGVIANTVLFFDGFAWIGGASVLAGFGAFLAAAEVEKRTRRKK